MENKTGVEKITSSAPGKDEFGQPCPHFFVLFRFPRLACFPHVVGVFCKADAKYS